MTGEWLWWIDNDRVVVAQDNGDGTYTAPAEAGKTIRIYGTQEWDDIGTDASALVATDSVPVAFHRAIVDGAIANGYLLPDGDYGKAAVFEQRFERGVARAQEYASRSRAQDGVKVKPCIIFGVDE